MLGLLRVLGLLCAEVVLVRAGHRALHQPLLVGEAVEEGHGVLVLLAAAVAGDERRRENALLVPTLRLFHGDRIALLEDVLAVAQLGLNVLHLDTGNPVSPVHHSCL